MTQSAPGKSGERRLPALAYDNQGELLLTWTEGTGWNRGGSVAWQLYDAKGSAIGKSGKQGDLPVWSFATPCARPDGSFEILY